MFGIMTRIKKRMNRNRSELLIKKRFETVEIYKLYKKRTVNVVMLGDSLMSSVDWNELLGRDDVANRSLGGDYTDGFLTRLESVYDLNPKICFVMGGVNDLPETSIVEVYGNFQSIVEGLISHNITQKA